MKGNVRPVMPSASGPRLTMPEDLARQMQEQQMKQRAFEEDSLLMSESFKIIVSHEDSTVEELLTADYVEVAVLAGTLAGSRTPMGAEAIRAAMLQWMDVHNRLPLRAEPMTQHEQSKVLQDADDFLMGVITGTLVGLTKLLCNIHGLDWQSMLDQAWERFYKAESDDETESESDEPAQAGTPEDVGIFES